MRTARRRMAVGLIGLGLGVAGLTGCQTYPVGYTNMTLPSPHYLKHYPQYFPPDPVFPLQRELDSMQDPDALTRRAPGAAPAPLPAPGGFQPGGGTPIPLPGPAPAN